MEKENLKKEDLLEDTESGVSETVSNEKNDNDLIFPEGPTLGQVEEWKSLYEDQVFMTDFENNDIFIWRPIRRSEYKKIFKVEGADAHYKEESISATCLLWPTNKGALLRSHGKAGIATILSELIMEKSGYNPNTTSIKL